LYFWPFTQTATSDNYQPYTQQLADQGIEQGKQVVLFFAAGWCPPCRKLDKNISADLASIPEDVLILALDYDSSGDVQEKYGVKWQHTLVYLDDKWNTQHISRSKAMNVQDIIETIGTL